MKTDAEIVVIGSGFGGAIAASRLARAGRDVVLLERGPWRDSVPNRSLGIPGLAPLPQGTRAFTHGLRSLRAHWFKRQLLLNRKGFIEAYQGQGINVICSSSVGGGGHVYAAMLAKPASPTYWDGHHTSVTQAGMDPYYAEMIALLGARAAQESDQVPNHISLTNHAGALSTEGLPSPLLGILLPRQPGSPGKVIDKSGAERWECDYSNDSILGSPSGAKTTLDFAVLWPAVQDGLEVRALCEAETIRKLDSEEAGAARYEVHYRDHQRKRQEIIRARHVILAAGCINTVRLLLKSRDIDHGLEGMPQLGSKFGTNGGFFAFWKENASTDLSRGLPLCGPFRSAGSRNTTVQVLRAAIQGLDAIPMPAFLHRWLRRNSFIVALGKDNNNGSLGLEKGRFKIRYDKAANAVYQAIDEELDSIRLATGTRIHAPGAPVTVQPLGGACLGQSNADGVIAANGEVFDNPGLYIADAAALPESPGRPPSLTIAVWAAHVADRLLETLQPRA